MNVRVSTARCAMVFFLALLTSGASCGGQIPAPTDALTDPVELLGAVERTSLSIQSARFIDVRLDYFGEQGRASVKQLILMEHPDRVRIQTYIPGFSGVAGVLVCACGQFAFHDRQTDIYHYGPATAENVARVLPVGLGCQDLAHVMLGGAPHQKLADFGQTPSMVWDSDKGQYKLVWLNSDGGMDARAELFVRHGDWRVASMTTWTDTGEKHYVYTSKDFEKVGDASIPHKRRFLVPLTNEDFSLSLDEVQLDPSLPETLFGLEPPRGTRFEYIGPASVAPPPPPGGDLCAD